MTTIDLRSDTVTVPTPAMLAAMAKAAVGDDVYGEDPTVNALQEAAAARFGMEAALFFPSGTMANQVAIKAHTRPGDEVICHELSHVYYYEGGGIAFHSGCSLSLIDGDRGRFTAEQVAARINDPADPHRPVSRLVVVENTVNKGGGATWEFAELKRIGALCRERGLGLHLDGARLFNALVARAEDPRAYGALFDTISICLSKGLGAPVGSLLLGSRTTIAQARRLRKVFGGGMRQAGYLAAAGLHALEHHVARLAEDHARAKRVAAEVARLPYVAEVLPADTNLVICVLEPALAPARLLAYLAERGIRAGSMGGQTVRFAFHLQVDDAQAEALVTALAAFPRA
jgi:threonine aldolase